MNCEKEIPQTEHGYRLQSDVQYSAKQEISSHNLVTRCSDVQVCMSLQKHEYF